MIANNQTLHKMTVSDVKRLNTGYFFSRQTMRFFGDKMTSFGIRTFSGKRILYRKPTAFVNTPFSGVQRAGKDFFSCWEVVVKSPETVDIIPTSEDFKSLFFASL